MIAAEMPADCPAVVQGEHRLERQIEAGGKFTPPIMIAPGARTHVEVSDVSDPSTVLFDPVKLREASGRVAGYAALEAMGGHKSRIEVLCADDAEVRAYIGARVTDALNPYAARITVQAREPHGNHAGLVGDNGYRYAYVRSSTGGVSPGGSSSGEGGVSSSQSGGVDAGPETGGVSAGA